MDLFTVMNIFLVTLLFKLTEALTESPDTEPDPYTTAEPVNSIRFGEFCLRTPDNSHWTVQPGTASTQPGSTQPGSTQPGSTQPGSTQPGSTQPGSTQPGSTQPQQTATQTTTDALFVAVGLQPVPLPLPLQASPMPGGRIRKGCRCQNKKMKPPSEFSQNRRITIWPPSRRCNSTEIMETLGDGSKVCVNTSSIKEYFDLTFASPRLSEATTKVGGQQGPPATVTVDDGPLDSDEHLFGNSYVSTDRSTTKLSEATTKAGGQQGPPTTVTPALPEANEDLTRTPSLSVPVKQMYEERHSGLMPVKQMHEKGFSEVHSISHSLQERVHVEQMPCLLCWKFTFWKSVNRKTVQSLEVRFYYDHCPVIIHVKLKSGETFCVDSSDPGFRRLLEML